MGVSDLKANIHLMVDEIENESILQTLFEFLSGKTTARVRSGKDLVMHRGKKFYWLLMNLRKKKT